MTTNFSKISNLAGQLNNMNCVNGNISKLRAGTVLVTSDTVSESVETGSIVTAGGLGVGGAINTAGLTVTGDSTSTDHTPVALFTTSTTTGDADSSICIKSRDVGESALFLTNSNSSNADHKTWAMYLEKGSGDLRFNYGAYDPLSGAFGDDNKLTIKTDGSITAASDTFLTSIFGFAAIGNPGHTNFASFSHLNNNNMTNYALMQSLAGRTILNAAMGQNITFRNNNEIKMTMTRSLFTSTIPITISDETPSTNTETGSITTAGGLGVDGAIHCNNIHPQYGIGMIWAQGTSTGSSTNSGDRIECATFESSGHGAITQDSTKTYFNINTAFTGFWMVQITGNMFDTNPVAPESQVNVSFRKNITTLFEGIDSISGPIDSHTVYANASAQKIVNLDATINAYNFFFFSRTGGTARLDIQSHITFIKVS